MDVRQAPSRARPVNDRAEVEIPLPDVTLRGDLVVPLDARGIVVLALHDVAECRQPFIVNLAEVLTTAEVPVATLRVGLVPPGGAPAPGWPELHAQIEMLSSHLEGIVDWVEATEQTRRLPIGVLATGTSVAAALETAARRKGIVRAIVAWNGRPDLARDMLDRVLAPTLFVVTDTYGGAMAVEREVMHVMRAPHVLATVPDEPLPTGERVAPAEIERLAADWFGRHLPDRPAARH